jgi:hypothetical protein
VEFKKLYEDLRIQNRGRRGGDNRNASTQANYELHVVCNAERDYADMGRRKKSKWRVLFL